MIGKEEVVELLREKYEIKRSFLVDSEDFDVRGIAEAIIQYIEDNPGINNISVASHWMCGIEIGYQLALKHANLEGVFNDW